ncbi:hypothetical protein [Ruegeria sp. HKCCSP351]|uniref:hypothetical protein n=1 Tax=Ruegeria sp. HKCCSP351 TaxID=2794832 RepID=UPI001AE65076|nr:hypothetical protein [Ruegeria sp. HKCCSP351]
MSDTENGNGTLDNTVAAKSAKTWEARLKEAREKRASVLAKAQEETSEEPVSTSVQTDEPPPPDDTDTEQIVSERVRSLNLDKPRVRKKRKTRVALVLVALLCGAALQWVIANLLDEWPPADAEDQAVLNALSETFLVPEEQPEAATTSMPDAKDAPTPEDLLVSGPPEPEPHSIPADVSEPLDEPNSRSVDPVTLDQSDVTPSQETESAVMPESEFTTGPNPEAATEKPEISLTPPRIFIPAQLEPTLAVTTASDIHAAIPAWYDSRLRNPNPLNKGGLSQVSQIAHDPIPPEIDTPANRPYTEVKPLPVTPVIDLEVSLFVPSRVSQETSNRALELLARSQATVVATARVGYRVRETQVRFYHPDDAENAAMAADALGGIARDFTSSGSKTRPGRIEVYLEGSGGNVDDNSTVQPDNAESLIARILREFR